MGNLIGSFPPPGRISAIYDCFPSPETENSTFPILIPFLGSTDTTSGAPFLNISGLTPEAAPAINNWPSYFEPAATTEGPITMGTTLSNL